ncbi:MAG TPA: DoxX family protein [Terracidiphilus sp.]|jgi:putative oxidoreductase|nr:DoxX family protein [Terracidiphilus sp.]
MDTTAPAHRKITVAQRLFASGTMARWAPLPLRLIVGFGMMQHGFAKLSRGPDLFAATLHGLSVPAPHLMALLTIIIELAGGLATLAGFAIPLFSLPMAGVLLVAMFRVHLQFGFSSIKLVSASFGRPQFGPPGYECDLLYLACLAALVLGGPGPLAANRLLTATKCE